MRQALRALCALSLVVLMQSCGRGDRPSESFTSPHIPTFSADESVGFITACPVAVSQSVSVAKNGSVNFELTASDPEGDPLVYLVSAPPAHGSVTVQGQTGAATYVPALGYCGPDHFRWQVSDATCQSSADVFITVIGPAADDVNVSVDQDASVSFQLTASDPGGDPLVYTVTQPPSHGSVVVGASTGAATYTPAAGYCGPDNFKYKVDDGTCESPEATVTITVNCPPPPDDDGDGVPNDQDECLNSDLRENVWVGECDTGVPNLIDGASVNDDGCSLADLVDHILDDAAVGADHPGQFVSGTIRSLRALVSDGLIAQVQFGAIVRCVGSLPQ